VKVELIGQILQRLPSLAEQKLSEALSCQAKDITHLRIDRILVRDGHVTETHVTEALSQQWDLPCLDQILQEKLATT
jgi:hypothetical protein